MIFDKFKNVLRLFYVLSIQMCTYERIQLVIFQRIKTINAYFFRFSITVQRVDFVC